MHRALLKGLASETGLRLAIQYEAGRRKATAGELAGLADLVDVVMLDWAAGAEGTARGLERLRAAGLATVLITPVELDGVVLGAIVVGDTDSRPVQEAWRPLLVHAAETLAAAVLYYRTRTLFDQAGDMVSWHSSGGRVTAVSSGVERVLGYQPAEVIGGPSDLIVDSGTLAAARAGAGAAGATRVVSGTARRKDGSIVWVETTARDAGASEIVAVTRDIAARKRADALLEAEKRFLESIVRGGRLDTVLEALCRFSEEQAPGSMCSAMLASGGRLYALAAPTLPAAFMDVLSPGVPIAPASCVCGTAAHRGERVITLDAQTDPLWDEASRAAMSASGLRSAWSTPIKGAGGEILGTFAVYYRAPRGPEAHELELIDRLVHVASIAIERQRTADALRESEQRYRTVVDILNEVIFQADTAGRLSFLSGSFTAVTGFAVEDALGRLVQEFIHPDDRGAHDTAVNEILGGQQNSFRQELRFLASGAGHRWIDLHVRPIRDGSGVMTGFAGIFTDVTDRKQLEAHLLVSDRMASMGTLVAGVAHEINNPLASLMLNLDYIGRELGSAAERLREPLRAAVEGAERVRDIVRNLKIFSRGDERKRPVDLHHVIDSTIRMAQNEMRHRASLVREYGALPLVEANEASLGQVFLNLLVNAAQSIPEGRMDVNEIRVSTYTERDGRAVVEIRDTGAGIPSENMKRIFDPFFTTKPIGLGTGLGLSICHRLVSSLGGDITVESHVGVGSVFRVAIPGAPNARITRRPITSPLPVARQADILIVDDEPGVGDAVQRMFVPPHKVTTVTSGEDALRRIRAGHRYDLILCDVMMPNMTGMQLHDELRRSAPAMAERMVFITGGAFTPSAKAFLAGVSNAVLEKPFDLKLLAATINEKIR